MDASVHNKRFNVRIVMNQIGLSMQELASLGIAVDKKNNSYNSVWGAVCELLPSLESARLSKPPYLAGSPAVPITATFLCIILLKFLG